MQIDPETFDFDHCNEEPIHRPEAIQSFGYLFALDFEGTRVEIHSDNARALFDLGDDDELLGADLLAWLDPAVASREFVMDSYARARSEDVRLPMELRFRSERLRDPSRVDFNAVVYASGCHLVIEVEPAAYFSKFITARQQQKIYAKNLAPQFRTLESVSEVAQAAADTVRALTGYERVVVYRFNPDGSGEVISESRVDDIDSYLGFYFPKEDIPAQARELYRRNWIRLNPDVELDTVELVPALGSDRRTPLDLSASIVRAMSPFHVQYIKNQGLRSTMSISLINRDELWGLIACHHRSAFYLPQSVRLECENLGHLFGWQLFAKEEELRVEQKRRADAAVDRLIEAFGQNDDIIQVFRSNESAVLQVMRATGFVFSSAGELVTLGRTPPAATVRALVDEALGRADDQVLATHDLASLLGPDAELDGACGALAAPMLPQRGFFSVWFRDEHPHTIRWAGRPKERSPAAPKRARMAVRESFELHEEVVRGESLPWSEHELDVAQRFNKFFLRHALQTNLGVQDDLDTLEKRDQVKNEFLATLAHELRNPLSPISNAVTVLRRDPDAAGRERALDVIDRQMKHLVTLLNDLLDVSRITRGKVGLDLTREDVRDAVLRGLEISQPLIDERNHQVEIDLPDEPVFVRADSTRLIQCFANLVNNAAKYTAPGGRIRVVVTVAGDDVAVEVSDNGIGIPPSHVGKVFDMFAQVEATSTQTQGGLGVGLTLTRNLIELHGGTIEATSEGRDRGSRFTVRLPRYDAETASAVDVRSTAGEADSSRAWKILLVEDNADVATMLGALLEVEGHEVLVCMTPQEALDRFSDFAPELALLDIGLPSIDGYQLCKLLQELDEENRCTFVAQTGWGQPEDKEKTARAGFFAHLVKPVTTDNLRKLFEDLEKAERDRPVTG